MSAGLYMGLLISCRYSYQLLFIFSSDLAYLKALKQPSQRSRFKLRNYYASGFSKLYGKILFDTEGTILIIYSFKTYYLFYLKINYFSLFYFRNQFSFVVSCGTLILLLLIFQFSQLVHKIFRISYIQFSLQSRNIFEEYLINRGEVKLNTNCCHLS